MALDALPAYDDRVPQLKVDMEVSTIEGFTSSVGCTTALQCTKSLKAMLVRCPDYVSVILWVSVSTLKTEATSQIIELIDPDINIATGEIYDTYISNTNNLHYEKSH